MSNISRALRLAAAAQRVSMEAADEAVQGQTGALDPKELARVAADAAAKVADDAAAKAKEVAGGGESTEEAAPAETPETTEAAVETPAAEEAPAGEEAAPATDELPPTSDAPADAEVPATGEETAAGETSTDEIQTPAEAELAEFNEQQVEEATAQATAEAGATPDAEAPAATEEAAAPVEGEQAAVEPAAVEGDATAIETPAAPAVEQPTQIEEAGIAQDDLAAAVDGGEVAAAAVEEAVAADTGAEETAAVPAEAEAEAPVAEAAPAAEEVAPAAPMEEVQEQAPAAAPGPQTDTNEAVQEVVTLTEAVAEAATAEDVVKQARQISDGLKEVAETAEVVNENGGVTMESMALLSLAVRAQIAPLERQPIGFGISLESFAGKPLDTRLQVSLEEIRDVIAELDQSQPYLERQAVESLDRVVAALKDALPSAADRLKAVISQASAAGDTNESAPVKIGDGLSAALCIDGAFPADLANELQTYSVLGNCLLGNYIQTAFRTAKEASLLVNAVDFTSASAFWEKTGAIVDASTDPRCTLTATQLESGLPGGARLFAEAQPELDSPNPVLKKLIAFNNSYAPLEAAVAGKCNGDAEATAPALSASKIVLVGKSLLDTICCERICEVLCEGQKLWPEAQDAIRHLRENLSNAPREIDQNVGADFSQLIKYVETSYSLATWPLVNFLANAVLTINAFVVFADRSLKAKAAELPAVEHSDVVVDEAAAV